ncbi:MAG: hypothetical protein F9K47_16020 [Burkholderiales bacterium]|nr:MAG: hypothetical protein F9K47_16020 [Burkholderiales bacterium]
MLPPTPTCSSFGAVSISNAPGSAPARVVDARRGDELLFVGVCAKGAGSTSNMPLSYQLLPGDGESPIATSQIDARFALTVPIDAPIGSLVPYRLRAEQAGAVSTSITAAYKVVDTPPVNPPSGCAVSPVAPFWYSGSTAATFGVSCTTGTLTGNASYGWFLNGASTGTTGSGYTPSNSLAVGNYTVAVRVCNDPAQQAAGGASCVTPSTTAEVRAVSNATPPTGCSISANGGQITLPATVNSGTSLTFSALNCQNTSGSTTYTWKRNGNTLSSNVVTFSNTSGVSITEGITLEACNPAVGGGSPACQTPTPSTSVTVLPAATQQGQNCTNYSGITSTQTHTRNLSEGWIIYDQGQQGSNFLPMTGSQAVVIAFTTPNFTGNFQGAISGGDNIGAASKIFVLGTAPCAEYNGSTKLEYQIGRTIQFDYHMGSGGRGPQLQPNTTYYLTIANRYWFGTGLANSCTVTQEGGCPTKVQITGPQ